MNLEQPRRFAVGHESLIRHPTNDLSPETIVIQILDSLPPLQGTVGAHKQGLACPGRPGGDQEDSAEAGGSDAVDGQKLRTDFGSYRSGVPLESR